MAINERQMTNNNNIKEERWIEKIKEKVNNQSEPIPSEGWDKLEQELSPATGDFVLIPHRWKYITGAAAIIAAIFSGAYYMLHNPAVADMEQAIENVVALTPETPTEGARPLQEFISPNPTTTQPFVAQTLTGHKRHKTTEKSTSHAPLSMVEEIVSAHNEGEAISTNNEAENTERSQANEQGESAAPKSRATVNHRPSGKDKQHLPTEPTRQKSKGSWSVGASVGNAGALTHNKEYAFSGMPYQVVTSEDTPDLDNSSREQTVIFKEGVPYIYNPDDIINAKHHQPISVGMNVRKALNHGFSIETGLMFTMLASDITLAGNHESTFKQKLHYLGIPIKANWNFLQSRYFTLYVSGGGQIEKCVYGKIGDEKINEKPWQFSVMGGIGAQVNISKHFGIYVEPGVAYFFENNSKLQTIRKEHPLNFNLQTGLRLTY